VEKVIQYKNNQNEIAAERSPFDFTECDEPPASKGSRPCPQVPDFLAFPLIIGYTFSPAMKSKQLVVGLDGGGTKTEAILADPSGTILCQKTGGPSNFQILGVEKAATVILDLVQQCSAEANCQAGDIAVVVAGLTGAGREADRNRMLDAVREEMKRRDLSFERVIIESDARIALEGAFGGAAGIILIGGTGSIAFGKGHDGSIYRVGGWGRILGDEGSGYAIGREGLNAVTRQLDGRIRSTILTTLVGQKFGLTSQEKIIQAVYKEQFDVASIAPLVIHGASQHDLECERILNKATFELTEHVRALLLKIEAASRGRARQKIPLAFIGGLLANDTLLRKIVHHRITFSLPQISIVEPESSPAQGAILLGMSERGM
jgi:N-acetylglucosamine kinase-like BadF-type ATPase